MAQSMVKTSRGRFIKLGEFRLLMLAQNLKFYGEGVSRSFYFIDLLTPRKTTLITTGLEFKIYRDKTSNGKKNVLEQKPTPNNEKRMFIVQLPVCIKYGVLDNTKVVVVREVATEEETKIK
uniref:Uncharacterized protein n=1 Tax=Octopus bimaculoides TaxID=37653 RepID=A0A0L8HSS8_OCTBM